MIGSTQQLFYASFHVLLVCDLLAFFGIDMLPFYSQAAGPFGSMIHDESLLVPSALAVC